MDSILQDKKECYLCRLRNPDAELSDRGLNDHHIVFGHGFRDMSEEHGIKCWLCPPHHTMTKESPHQNRNIDLMLKRAAQKKYEETHKREEWRTIFGKSYL